MATPIITSVSQTGGTITVNGSNFGTKSNGAAPLVFDNYESYANGTLWSSMPIYSDQGFGGNNPYVSNALSKGGTKSFRMDIPFVPITDGSTQETIARVGYTPAISMTKGVLAISRFTHQTTFASSDNTGGHGIHNEIRIDKFIRIGSNPTYSGPPLFSDSQAQVKLELLNQADTDIGDALADRTGYLPTEQWVTARILFDYGTANNANGSVFISYGGQTIFNFSNLAMITTSKVIEWAMLWVLFDYYQGTAYSIYQDEFYFDNSQAHFFIANTASLSAISDNLAVQPATAWATGQITGSFNQSNFTNGSTAYAFVMNENKEINTTGFPFVVGGGSSPTSRIPIYASNGGF